MTKSLAYIGVIALVAGVLLTTCVGSAWSMELLTDEQMALVRGTDCLDQCCDGNLDPTSSFGCTDHETCFENQWVCKKIFPYCVEQFYKPYIWCKGDPSSGNKCEMEVDSGVDCMWKLRNPVPPDGVCDDPNDCYAAVDPPCGDIRKCILGSDWCD